MITITNNHGTTMTRMRTSCPSLVRRPKIPSRATTTRIINIMVSIKYLLTAGSAAIAAAAPPPSGEKTYKCGEVDVFVVCGAELDRNNERGIWSGLGEARSHCTSTRCSHG